MERQIIGGIDYIEVRTYWVNGQKSTQQFDMSNEDEMNMLRDWTRRGIKIKAFKELVIRKPTGQLLTYTPSSGWIQRY